jgi:predicted ATP-dependent serine protease
MSNKIDVRDHPETEEDGRRLVRLSSGLTDLDYLLGGSTWASEQGFQSHWGFVQPSVALLAGADGVGRTMLMLQVAANVARKHGRVLYVSGSESDFLCPNPNLSDIEAQITIIKPVMLVLDSMRTMRRRDDNPITSRASALHDLVATDDHLNAVAHFAANVSKKHNLCVVLVTSKPEDGDILMTTVVHDLMDVILVLYKRTRPASELEWRPCSGPLSSPLNRYGRLGT